MIEHVTDWLNAYLDDELGGLRLRQVEGHLKRCAACRAELDELSRLSTLLRETPPPARFKPTERFAAGLVLRLPRRPAAASRQAASAFAGWLVPVGVLAAWVVLQAFLSASTVVSVAGQLGLLGDAAALLQEAPQHSDWFALSSGFFGAHLDEAGRTGLELLDQVDVLGADLLWQLALQFLIALAYWAGLGGWLLLRRRGAGGFPLMRTNG
jgi:hypothetical protein